MSQSVPERTLGFLQEGTDLHQAPCYVSQYHVSGILRHPQQLKATHKVCGLLNFYVQLWDRGAKLDFLANMDT